jgi:hypothetical protein
MTDLTATFPQFTNLKLNEGLVDQLMATVKFHVHAEYAAQRITSADYATVFLGALESVMANSTQYLLGTMLLEEMRLKIQAEIKLIELEGEKLQFEIDYMYPAQLIKLQQEGKLIEAQVRLAEANILLTDAQILKIYAEIDLIKLQEQLIDAQVRKIDKEIEFIDAKIKTELANTVVNFDAGSIVGRQTDLLRAQTLGFSGELYHKVSKLHADYAAVYESVNEQQIPALTGLAAGYDAKAVAAQIAPSGYTAPVVP